MKLKRPPLREVREVLVPEPNICKLSNGIPLYEIRLGAQEIVRIECIFTAGRWYEQRPLTARSTAWIMREGTAKHNAAEIAEELDFYGASLRVEDGFDTSTISLYCLTKHLPKLLPLLREILTEPIFPQSELDHYIARSKQRLVVDLEKVDVVAYRILTESLFGKQHPYGYNSSLETYESLRTEHLMQHYQNRYLANNCTIFVSGKTDDKMLKTIDEYLGTGLRQGTPLPALSHPVPSSGPTYLFEEKADSSQSALRLGRRLFTRNHPDYHGMYVLNTVLGGYFGARLMSNLREDKGYTYGVYSSIDTLNNDGYFYISTEVDKDAREKALTEIRLEMNRLCEEPLGNEELTMVRNYLMGNALRALDGPFNVSDVIRDLVTADLDTSFFKPFVDTIQNITPAQLQDLAKKYLNLEDYTTVVVG